MTGRARALAFLAAVLTSAAAALIAQQNPTVPPPTFRGGTNLIVLDVSVLDGNRRPVVGLDATDFTVSIDGRRTPVTTFKSIASVVSARTPSATGPTAGTPAPVTAADRTKRIVVILIDDYSFSEAAIDIGGTAKAKEVGLAVVRALRDDDRASVHFTGDSPIAQPVTTDRFLLQTAIQKAVLFGSDITPDQSGGRGHCYCGLCSIDAIGRVAESLAEVQDERKLIVYVSAGSLAPRPDSPGYVDECTDRKRDALRAALDAAHRFNVRVDAIDPKGVMALPRSRRASAGPPTTLQPRPLNDEPAFQRMEFLRTIAESTGGRAIVNHNEPQREVPGLLAESEAYYLIGVERPPVEPDGRLHEIDVRVNRRGVTVQSRKGFYAPTR
jgi:VWFA-related protein